MRNSDAADATSDGADAKSDGADAKSDAAGAKGDRAGARSDGADKGDVTTGFRHPFSSPSLVTLSRHPFPSLSFFTFSTRVRADPRANVTVSSSSGASRAASRTMFPLPSAAML